jgi:hypothetical protein
MHLLGEYFDEREWLLNHTVPFYVLTKVDLMNASGFESTKGLKETMSSMYLACAKYDRMYRQCMNKFGGALLDDPFNKAHAECNNILRALNTCIRNNQWFHETKKYHPELFNAWKGKDYQGYGDPEYVSPDDI